MRWWNVVLVKPNSSWLQSCSYLADISSKVTRCAVCCCVALRRWAYNANSGDTGGLVDETWQNLDWTKLGWMQDNLGLTPWYKQ